MRKIFLVGAGKTSTYLIEYLLNHAEKENWFLTVGDYYLEAAEQKVKNHPRGKAIKFDVNDKKQRESEISKADLVISFLPPTMHLNVAKDCLKYKSHLVTASYISKEMKELKGKVKKENLIFLNEMGLDPGIDHMDAVRLITKIKSEGGKIISFKSFGSGLITPESKQNPWKYKFTWSPVNVVLAGQHGAKYIEDSNLKMVPYGRIFMDPKKIKVPDLGEFEAYPNRDSLHYQEIYGLKDIPNFYRATLRNIGYSKAWNLLIKIGLTDDSYKIEDSEDLTYRDWVLSYLPNRNGKAPDEALAEFLEIPGDGTLMKKLMWLGILSDEKIRVKNASPAEILLDILEKKWRFNEKDKDMVILQTEIEYELIDKTQKVTSTMVVKGKDHNHTAMAKTVGLPVAIGVKYILNNRISERGIVIPIHKEIYEPALKELSRNNIKFEETVNEVKPKKREIA